MASSKAYAFMTYSKASKTQQRCDGEDARAAVSDQQMRPARPRYPVDRYLVESNKKVEIVNIIDEEIWNPGPALRPEDEIVLRKLHDMLQSTADDLKLLSGELSKINKPGIQIKSQPTPLDEEFNEKVHIEEVVNAKFYGHKIVDKSLPFSPESKPNKEFVKELLANKIKKPTADNASVQVNSAPLIKKTIPIKNLQVTRPKVVCIKENKIENLSIDSMSAKKLPSVSYNEIAHQYYELKEEQPVKRLQIQNMPGISIRSELKEQKVLQLDILPELRTENNAKNVETSKNVRVTEVQFESSDIPPILSPKRDINVASKRYKIIDKSYEKPIRKISKMSTFESSESSNNDTFNARHKLNLHNKLRLGLKTSPKRNERLEAKSKNKSYTNNPENRMSSNLDEWKTKLNSVYDHPSNSHIRGMPTKSKKASAKYSNISTSKMPSTLNNAEYIPYAKLTLGGVRVSDIEREISDIPNKNDLQLSPILDKILSSRENSLQSSPRKHKKSSKILTTSDENLLQEVIDIEKTVSVTLSKEFKEKSENIQLNLQNENEARSDSYADDFEEVKSDQTENSRQSSTDNDHTGIVSSDDANELSHNKNIASQKEISNTGNQQGNIHNTTYTKVSNLSFKDSVDIFEFVHLVDTQETGTQSASASKISLKETQTSPRNDKSNIQPIRNELWPSIDPKGEVEKLFELEKEFIKKLIIAEYGEVIESNIMKPSTSKEKDKDRRNNVTAFQKNTQTSPAHVKCVMTSPTRTKTRTTSPFSLSLTIDRQTSPMILATNEEDFKIVIDNEPDDLGISINLSSPRFSLRLPQNSREVLSNLDNHNQPPSKIAQENTRTVNDPKTFKKYAVSSSSSEDADKSSSEISSFGEIKLKMKRKIRKSKVVLVSASSSSSISRRSSEIVSGEILPLKSEGEVSLGRINRKSMLKRRNDSDGEMNFGST